MIRVLLVGTGNVSRQLADAWQGHDKVRIEGVCGRNPVKPEFPSLPYFHLNQALPEADVIVIAVADDAIADVAARIDASDALLVHTSGRTPMRVLEKAGRHGVFYPLQSFAPGRKIDFSSVPLCLEVSNPEDRELLAQLAQSLGAQPHWIDSEQREKLHLAAVLVNNFSNHLYTLAADLLKRNELDFDLLLPLVRETTARLDATSPAQSQTGPAIRNDRATMEAHLKILQKQELRELYEVFSKSIQAYHGSKL